MAQCILMRHGESEWNASGRLAGLSDIKLTPMGREQARRMAECYRDVPLHVAYVSELIRTKQTLDEVTRTLALPNLSVVTRRELNERDCGAYTGRSKAAIRAELGPEEFARHDKDWNYAPPEGESMAVLRQRVTNFYNTIILPQLREDCNVLIVSSYNPMRILKWYIQDLPEEAIGSVTAGNAEVCICSISTNDEFLGMKSFEGRSQTE